MLGALSRRNPRGNPKQTRVMDPIYSNGRERWGWGGGGGGLKAVFQSTNRELTVLDRQRDTATKT